MGALLGPPKGSGARRHRARGGRQHDFHFHTQAHKQTVAPLAASLAIEPSDVPAPAVLAQQVSSGALGRVILIAGHSNTVPQMIAALGVPGALLEIGEREFDNLFVVTVASTANAHLLHLKYGAPS
jgi:hypothetical protein